MFESGYFSRGYRNFVRSAEKRKISVKKEKHEIIFKKMYSSDNGENDDNYQAYPSNFKKDDEDSASECLENRPILEQQIAFESRRSNEKEVTGTCQKSHPSSERVTGETTVGDEMSDRSSKESLEESSSDEAYNEESAMLNADPGKEDPCKKFKNWLQTADGGKMKQTPSSVLSVSNWSFSI